jgi:hypothetical protein
MTLKEMVKLAVNGVSKEDALKYDSLGLDVDTIIEAKKNNVDIADLASALEENSTESDGEGESGSDGSQGDESNNEGTGEADSTDFEKLYKEEHEKLVALQEKNTRNGSDGDEKSLEDIASSIFKEW